MSRSIFSAKRIEAFQLIGLPASVVIVISLLLLVMQNRYIACSVFSGGLIWIIPNLYFAGKVFSTIETNITPQRMLKNFYQAEIVKLILYAALFIIIVKFLSMAVLPLLAGFGLAQLTFWLAPFLLSYVKKLK